MKVDKNLEFLKYCSHKDLDTLAYILVYDKDDKKRISESLSLNEKYKAHYPKHSLYVGEIINEFQCYGGNTVANTFRGGKGVPYREILEDVCDLFNVKYDKLLATHNIEDLLLLSIFESSLDKMSDEERRELLQTFNKKTTDITKPAIMAIVQAAIRQGGFATYRLSAVIANAVVKSITGRGIAFVGNQTMMKGISIMSGPIGWIITGGWTAIELAGPAYRVTVPTVMETIYLRRKCNRPFYKAKRMFLRFLDQFLQFLQLIRFNKA